MEKIFEGIFRAVGRVNDEIRSQIAVREIKKSSKAINESLRAGKPQESIRTITLNLTNNPDMVFLGERLKSVTSLRDYNQHSWWELNLYKTNSGKWVCEEVKFNSRRDRVLARATVFDHLEDIRHFFGYRSLAKELYRELNIDMTTYID